MQSADLKRHALNILELSRKFLMEDDDLDPTAFLITADDQLLRPIDLQDEVAKVASCSKIVDEARRRKALAIITCFCPDRRTLINGTKRKNNTSGAIFRIAVQKDRFW